MIETGDLIAYNGYGYTVGFDCLFPVNYRKGGYTMVDRPTIKIPDAGMRKIVPAELFVLNQHKSVEKETGEAEPEKPKRGRKSNK